jgi:hypothetical protein
MIPANTSSGDNLSVEGLYSRIMSLMDTVGSGFDKLMPHPASIKAHKYQIMQIFKDDIFTNNKNKFIIHKS